VSGNSFPLSKLTKRHNVKFGDLTAILLYKGARSRDNKSSHVTRAAPRIFVTVVDGEAISSNNGMVMQEMVPLMMVTLRGHIEQIQFDVINIENHAMILSMP